jgi:hypothetical protein
LGVDDRVAPATLDQFAQPLPFELKPGVVWSGIIIQAPQIVEWATTGILDMVVYHSHTSKPLRQRVVISKRKQQTTP